MRIETPHEFERVGAVIFHGLQKVFELDSGLSSGDLTPQNGNGVIQRIPYDQLYDIERQMAIIIPVRDERLKLVQGVLCGVPHQCLTIVVSNSPRAPIDRFGLEEDSIETFSKFTNKNVIVVHQQDPALAQAFAKAGYRKLLGRNKKIRDGKAEGMLLGIMLAHLAGKKYVGFIDSDNYFPGAVLEYIHEYAAGFAVGKSKYTMVRIAWHSKPKVVESDLYFAKWGRASVMSNRFINSLISFYSGYETDTIKTGNAGEHAMTMDLAMMLHYASGYAIEPYHLINLVEKYGGIKGQMAEDIIRQRIDVFQIESRNPHLHGSKGDEHIEDMVEASLSMVHHSKLCPPALRAEIQEELKSRGGRAPKSHPLIYPPLSEVDCKVFSAALKDHPAVQALLFEREPAST